MYSLSRHLLKTRSSSYSLFKLVKCDREIELPKNDRISGSVDYSRQCLSRHTAENLTPTAVERIPICQTSAPVSSVSFDVWRSMAKPLSSSVEYSSAETYSIRLIFTVEHHLHITSASFLIKFEILLLKRANSSLLFCPLYKRMAVHAVFRLFTVRQCLWSFIAQFCSLDALFHGDFCKNVWK